MREAETKARSSTLTLPQAMRRAMAAYDSRDWAAAEPILDAILKAQPGHFDALHLLGVIAAQTQRLDRAVDFLGRALAVDPNSFRAHNNLGNALEKLNRPNDAIASYDRAIAIKPDYAEAYFNRGNTLRRLERPDDAVASYDRAIDIRPDYAEAHYQRGVALRGLERLDDALASFDRALEIAPDYAETHISRGNVLQELKQLDAAVASYNQAIAIEPNDARPYHSRGNALAELRRLDDALASYDRAVALKPDYAEAYNNRANVLKELKRLKDAVASYDRAIALKPDYAEVYNNRGVTLHELKQLDAAIASFDRAIALKPDLAAVYKHRGHVLQELKQFEAAADSYERAISLEPEMPSLRGYLLSTKMRICDWSEFDAAIPEIVAGLEQGRKTIPPFALLALLDSPPLHRRAAELSWVDQNASLGSMSPIQKRQRSEILRIGYYSADFHTHATAHLMAELFERHDRSRFELIAFSFGPDRNDATRQRLSDAFDKFVDVRFMSDKNVAELSRNLRIDIAVDLKGFTLDERSSIFAYRTAPIQVNYLGYPGTMGADFMDYIIADHTLIPEESRQYYAEKVVYLPNSYQVNDRQRRIADKEFSRVELGLPADAFVFCCFNNNHKITPAVFDGWMRILKRVPGSALWLLEDNAVAANNLRKEAEARGVSPTRLIFAPRMPSPEHLARHRAADLFIDTLPFNAHTTASDALWAGLPVLTQIGESFAARVAASLLKAVGLEELVTTSQEDYEALAVELATNLVRLAEIKRRLNRERLAKPLFDTELFTRHLEEAYQKMYDRYQNDLPPDHIFIQPASWSSRHM